MRLLPGLCWEKTYKIWFWDGLFYRARPPGQWQAEQNVAVEKEARHGCDM